MQPDKSRLSRSFLLLLLVSVFSEIAWSCWKPADYEDSFKFISKQAGAPFVGTFHKFDAEICFNPDHPDVNDHINVTVETASVDAKLPELDDALKGPDFFYSEKWPTATFQSDRIEPLGNNHFRVTGKFTLRNVTHTINVPFELKYPANSDTPKLIGSTTIKRLDYDIGLGEWKNTKWVEDEVILEFSVQLKQDNS